jgi:hypothetical protein
MTTEGVNDRFILCLVSESEQTAVGLDIGSDIMCGLRINVAKTIEAHR